MKKCVLIVLVLIGVSSCMTNIDWNGHEDFAYQLQGYQFDRLRDSNFSLFVIDAGAAGNSPRRIEELKNAYEGERRVLCYLSIGEAEVYRTYWKKEWKKNPPSFLDEENPRWKGNYKVKYWDPEWKKILYGSSDSLLDKILALGFDGIYLDIVDAYQYYEEQGRVSAAEEMVSLVEELAEYSRRVKPGFGVFPQNAEELGVRFPRYMSLSDGIGIEDLFYGNPLPGSASPEEWTQMRIDALLQWRDAGKLVLTTDYAVGEEQIFNAYKRSRSYGFVPYVTDIALGTLRINPGLDP